MLLHHILWKLVVVAGYLTLLAAIGGLGAALARFICKVSNDRVAMTRRFPEYATSSDRLRDRLFATCHACYKFYMKSAGWILSVIIVLLLVGGGGLLIGHSVAHWRQIWGP